MNHRLLPKMDTKTASVILQLRHGLLISSLSLIKNCWVHRQCLYIRVWAKPAIFSFFLKGCHIFRYFRKHGIVKKFCISKAKLSAPPAVECNSNKSSYIVPALYIEEGLSVRPQQFSKLFLSCHKLWVYADSYQEVTYSPTFRSLWIYDYVK
jgi:hypothetical protein